MLTYPEGRADATFLTAAFPKPPHQKKLINFSKQHTCGRKKESMQRLKVRVRLRLSEAATVIGTIKVVAV